MPAAPSSQEASRGGRKGRLEGAERCSLLGCPPCLILRVVKRTCEPILLAGSGTESTAVHPLMESSEKRLHLSRCCERTGCHGLSLLRFLTKQSCPPVVRVRGTDRPIIIAFTHKIKYYKIRMGAKKGGLPLLYELHNSPPLLLEPILYTVGLMFWLRWKKLVGSYVFLRATSRS